MTAIRKLREMLAGRKAQAATSYAGLVKDIAAGKGLPEDVIDKCVGFGRSIADLERDVETLSSRLEADQQLQRAKQLETDHVAASNKATELHRTMEELAKRHKAEMDAAQSAYNAAYLESRSLERQRGLLVERATRVLTATCDPAISAKIQRLTDERSRLQADCNDSGRMAAQAEQLPEPQRSERQRQTAEMLKSSGQRIAAIGSEIEQLEADRLKPESFNLD